MFIDIEEKRSAATKQPAVGIDFGTTHCVVGLCTKTGVQILEVDGQRLIPSVVGAQRSIKRQLGLQEAAFPLAVEMFHKIQTHITKALGYSVTAAVVTVPAYFDEVRRGAVKRAAQEAGFRVLRLLAEPTAAALAYGVHGREEDQGLYGVYDLGGGTFDFSLLKMEGDFFQVLAIGGDNHLGGDDIDAALVARFPGLSLEEARGLKEGLSQQDSPVLTMVQLEEIMTPFVQRTEDIVLETLQDAGYMPQDLKGLFLVGGATRSPCVRQAVERVFPGKVHQSLNPDEVVAVGAALQAYNLTEEASFLLLDVTPLSLGIETFGGLNERLIPRHSPLPAEASYVFTTAESGQTKIRIHVIQGERELASACRSLGIFELSDIPPLPKGQARVRITLSLDADGLLTLEAFEETVGKKMVHTLCPHEGLSDKVLTTASYCHESDSGEDIVERLWIQKVLQAEEALKESDRLMTHYAALFTQEECTSWKERCARLRAIMEQKDYQALSAGFDTFTQELLPLVERYVTHIFKERLS